MRIAIGVAYDGAAFDGWQSQPSGRTVQDALERALAAVASQPVRVIAAGRTDAGVHAMGQVAHFDTHVERPVSAWTRGVNAHLPDAVAVHWAHPVDDAFHARFAARGRTYRYVLYDAPVRPAIYARQLGWFHRRLDLAAL
jgi:tRNA pseudouridine38-40 synthase